MEFQTYLFSGVAVQTLCENTGFAKELPIFCGVTLQTSRANKYQVAVAPSRDAIIEDAELFSSGQSFLYTQEFIEQGEKHFQHF